MVHLDGAPVSSSAPPAPGELLEIYATGLGAIDNNLLLGAAAPSDPPDSMTATPAVRLADTPLAVTFSGLAPGFVGLYQINAVAPERFMFTGPVVITLLEAGQQTQLSLQ